MAKPARRQQSTTIAVSAATAAASAATAAATLAETVATTARALAVSTNLKHTENTERLIHMTEVMESHIKADATAFRTLGEQAVEANKDLKSLLGTRTFTYGVWKTLTVIGTVAAAIGSAIAFLVPAVQRWFN